MLQLHSTACANSDWEPATDIGMLSLNLPETRSERHGTALRASKRDELDGKVDEKQMRASKCIMQCFALH